MMSANSLSDILEELCKVTENRKLKWEIDPTGGYLTRVGQYTINVFEDPHSGYAARMLDFSNTVVDSVHADELDITYPLLRRLFDCSRRNALNIDDAINNVLATLRRL